MATLEPAGSLLFITRCAKTFTLTGAKRVPHVEHSVFHLLATTGHGSTVTTRDLIHSPGLVTNTINRGGALSPHTLFTNLLSFATG